MALSDPDSTYGWHEQAATWREIKIALVLAVTVLLGALLLF